MVGGMSISFSPYGLVAMIIARQIHKKRRLEREGWEEKDDDLNPISHIVEIPQIPSNTYPPQLTHNTYYYINNDMECETQHHLDVGEQYNHSFPE
jgi:hypothetical protein